MDPQLARSFRTGTLEAYTYDPFIGDTKWYEAAKRKYNPIYKYKTTDEGIAIIEIHKHLHESLPYPPGFKPTKPNGITVYFPDTSEDQLPYGSTTKHIIFEMDTEIRESRILCSFPFFRPYGTFLKRLNAQKLKYNTQIFPNCSASSPSRAPTRRTRSRS